eukprot:jgi/Hompol1/5151/HPOL_001123-RA
MALGASQRKHTEVTPTAQPDSISAQIEKIVRARSPSKAERKTGQSLYQVRATNVVHPGYVVFQATGDRPTSAVSSRSDGVSGKNSDREDFDASSSMAMHNGHIRIPSSKPKDKDKAKIGKENAASTKKASKRPAPVWLKR